MERVLGFDPGQNTGWACIEGGKVIDSGMIVYSDNRIDYIKKVMVEKGINKIDFLFVAYNHLHQEKWIMRNKDKIPAKVSIGCGGTFDFIVGNCSLPPDIYAKYNLGWLYRLIKQPWRIKRIIKAFPIFPMKVYVDSISIRGNNALKK